MTEPQVRDPEIQSEQVYLDAAYARLESMRLAARRVREAYSDVRAGGTHQARLERDIAYDITQRRLADLDIGEAPLCFGRLDLEAGAGDPYYIGRLAVEDADHTPLVIDWRAPVAEPFYRATAIAPMGVVRRRHFITRHGREIAALDDEVFDRDATESAGLQVSGEGALLGALERDRTGRMGDIVATIQAEQDEAIRADLPGLLVVGGGPGTGKTAVALHRAAYLLYTHRRRLASTGVLLVGPSPVFLRYIEQVLPSLGEQDVQLTTIGGLKPQLDSRPREVPEIAMVKGDARMAAVVAKAVADRQRALPRDLALAVDGLRVTLRRDDSARVVQGARRMRGTHNERRRAVARRTIDMLVARYKAAAVRGYQESRVDNGQRAAQLQFGDRSAAPAGPDPLIARALVSGEPLPEGWERDLADRLRRMPQVREALDRMWPVLSGPELINDLLGFRALVRSAATGILDDAEQELLHRPRAHDAVHSAWTDADVAVIDEADALLGPVEAARPRTRRRRGDDTEALETAQGVVEELRLTGSISGTNLLARYGDSGNNEPSDLPEPRTFGHVLVDEAQDLTAMQWRMLARRCPSGSMTLVGDPAQASRPAALADWDSILALLPRHTPPRSTTLTVNYRTPSEIMEVANRLLSAASPTVEPSRSVRSTGEWPRFVSVEHTDVAQRAASIAAEATGRGGKVALIAPVARHGELVALLADRGATADPAIALDAPIAVLDATDAKGLEFDHVVVVEPAALVNTDRAGLRLLYVTITRATKTLAVVHAEPLPEALEGR